MKFLHVFSKLRVRPKLIAIFLVIGIVPMAIVGLISYRTSSNAQQHDALVAQQTFAYDSMEKLNRMLWERYGDAQAFAAGTAARSMDPKEITAFMNRMVAAYSPMYKVMAVTDANCKVIAVNTVRPDGSPLASSKIVGEDDSDKQWCTDSAAGKVKPGHSFMESMDESSKFQDLYGDKGNASDAVLVAAPIRDASGKVIGVWSNRMDWTQAKAVLDQARTHAVQQGNKSQRLFLLDSSGKVVYSIHEGDVLKKSYASAPVVKKATGMGASGSFIAPALDGSGVMKLIGFQKDHGFAGYPGEHWLLLASQDKSEALADSTSLFHETILLIVLAALAIAGVAFLIARFVSNLVNRYSAFAGQVAEGDLTAHLEVKGEDEFAQLGGHPNDMVANLRQMSGEVLQNAQAVSSSASQILATVSEQTAGANEQSAAINETTTATEEIRASAQQAADKANEVATQAQEAVRASSEGAEAVEAIVGGMDQIRDKVEAIASDVQQLSEKTAQIGEITSAVNDLADQSNLLALNATIEAARAGEQGKGFAVVADEVRNLAEQSKQATAQVQAILEDIERATHAAVSTAQEGTEVVEHGTQLAQQAGEIIAQLAEVNGLAAQSAQQIAASVQQQNAGMDQIAQGMQETSQATQDFVNGVQQSQDAAQGLSQVASTLEQLASHYKV
ncbi:MAG: methyl-accepting chemotaxis protein [Thermoleophilaceae bacterium]